MGCERGAPTWTVAVEANLIMILCLVGLSQLRLSCVWDVFCFLEVPPGLRYVFFWLATTVRGCRHGKTRVAIVGIRLVSEIVLLRRSCNGSFVS